MAQQESPTTIKADATAPRGEVFRLRTQLLRKGRSHTILASTRSPSSAMNVAIKCYAEGGENEFHTHAGEDHTFIVLQGQAIFYQPDLPAEELRKNQGILLPAGSYYKFEQIGAEPLVMLRVGNSYQPRTNQTLTPIASQRLDRDGKLFDANSKENRNEGAREPIEGAFYE